MKHIWIPPAQMWNHGLAVDVVFKQYSGGRSLFGIYSPVDDTFIPSQLHECISYVPTRLPTQ